MNYGCALSYRGSGGRSYPNHYRGQLCPNIRRLTIYRSGGGGADDAAPTTRADWRYSRYHGGGGHSNARKGGKVKKIIGLGFLAFLVVAAIVGCQHVFGAAGMAIVIGVTVGVATSIPVSLLVMARTRRNRGG